MIAPLCLKNYAKAYICILTALWTILYFEVLNNISYLK